MARDDTIDAFSILTNRTNDIQHRQTQQNRQRRNLVTDDFDKEYDIVGDQGVNGSIWLAISPDLIYIERWEFKVIVEPFTVPLASGDSAMSPVTLTIPPVDLEVSETALSAETEVDFENESASTTITPDPHTHTITPNPLNLEINPRTHTHHMNAGVTLNPSQFTDLHILLDGHDFTAQFKAQFPDWISGEGMFPDTTVSNRYDILKALDSLPKSEVSQYLQQGYHRLEFQADGIYSIKIREFKKYSFINRQGGSHGEANALQTKLFNHEPEDDLEDLKEQLLFIENEEVPSELSAGKRTVYELKKNSAIIDIEQKIQRLENNQKVGETNGE